MTTPVYANFDLLVDRSPTGTGYRTQVIHAPAGDAHTDFVLPFTEDGSIAMNPRIFGAELYQAAFGGEVGVCLRRSFDLAMDRGAALRVRLCLSQDVLDLAEVPWEYLFVPEWNRFLTLSDLTPIVRYIELDQPVWPLRVRLPLTILVILSNPSDVQPLAVQHEWRTLQDALSGLVQRRLINLEPLEVATLSALQSRLQRGPVNLLHFIGHGFFDPKSNTGGLVFENAQGRRAIVTAETLAMLLHDHKALRLVFLNACQGAQGGRSDPFAGLAQRLVQQGVPTVLAMQFPVSDRAAITLAQAFYQALAEGMPADTALSEARKAIAAVPNEREWATPVLFSRSDDNRLFELPQGDARSRIDLRMPLEPETMLIPSGPFLMGSDDPAAPAWERPQHAVDLFDFRIGKYPVTNRQYAEFVRREKNQDVPKDAGWFLREPPADRLDHPVTGVSWDDAVAYCRWLGTQSRRNYRLPTEAEWEKAACWAERGDRRAGSEARKRRYPWGDEWVDGRCNAGSAATMRVDAHPAGASAYDCEDMLGNVQEWTATLWGTQPGRPQQTYQDRPDGGPAIFDPADLPAQARIVHRGGSYKSEPAELRCSARGNAAFGSKIPWRGFRVALDIEERA